MTLMQPKIDPAMPADTTKRRARARLTPAQTVQVLKSADFGIVDGPNMGEDLSFADDLLLDDVFEVPSDAQMHALSLRAQSIGRFTVAEDTTIGTPGATLILDSALTLMTPAGGTVDALILVEIDEDGHAAGIFLLPLTVLLRQTEYRLVGIDTDAPHHKFAEVACVSFTRGTQVALASGAQCPVEDLKPGDRILTRDDGVQPLRWIGQTTVRAVGDFAPICITAGTLNNENDLLVSPDHRLFIYQREDVLGAGRSEVLVKARHLVNDTTVRPQEGGFVDYFQLLFDSHQIIYAEGIAVESMLIDTRTKPVLPADLTAELGEVIPGHSDLPHAGLDVDQGLLDVEDVAELLKKASTR